MTRSTGRRKNPEDRRGEIVEAASALMAEEGVQSLTLRRVAQKISVAPGLVSHYFTTVDTLVAEAFSKVAFDDVDRLFEAVRSRPTFLEQMRSFLTIVLGEQRDSIYLLTGDAIRASRDNLLLREEVEKLLNAWESDLAAIIRSGIENKTFFSKDAMKSSIHILALVDSFAAQIAARAHSRLDIVREMIVSVTERELGLDRGELNLDMST